VLDKLAPEERAKRAVGALNSIRLRLVATVADPRIVERSSPTWAAERPGPADPTQPASCLLRRALWGDTTFAETPA